MNRFDDAVFCSVTRQKHEDQNADIKDYLSKLNENTYKDSIRVYCGNRFLNALLDDFAERCERVRISFTVKIVPPPADTIDDYGIILGNLLENALTAYANTPENRQRYIMLSMCPRGEQYGIKVENSYDGVLKHEGKELYSTKTDGSMGIRSIKSVTGRHNGEYVPVWDDEKFSAFVVLKLGISDYNA